MRIDKPLAGRIPSSCFAVNCADKAILEAQWIAVDIGKPNPRKKLRHVNWVEMLAARKRVEGWVDGAPVAVEVREPIVTRRQRATRRECLGDGAHALRLASID